MEDWRNGGFGLYLHWPFCQSKCPYCDFNSHVTAQVDQRRWRSAYLSEIERLGREMSGRTLDTVFFGGGTPSLMEPDLVASIVEAVRRTWPMVNDPEITLEANPGSVDAGRFSGFRDAGVNRISMGIQALNDGDLRRLGRLHTVSEAYAAFDVAKAHFDRVSFDLIYARQNQGVSAWQAELRRALDLAVDHLSLYQLTVEDGTPFGARFAGGGLRGLPDEDLATELYRCTQEMCDSAGMSGYEVSNHARPGQESRHNLIYWRGGDYVGIGPGAHGRLTLGGVRWATEAPKSPGQWLTQVESGAAGEIGRSSLSALEHAQEYIMMSMRLTEGADVARITALLGAELAPEVTTNLVELGMIKLAKGRISASPSGRLLLNAVLRDLLPV